MPEFEYKSFIEQRKMALEELKMYYRALRKYEYGQDLPIKGIELRKKCFFLVKLILKIDRLLNLRNLKIIGDKRIPTQKPKIFACTHIGRYDIESAMEAVGEASWFVMGDPGETYRNVDGLLLRLHGVSWFDMEDKFDAHTVNTRQKKILNQGGNELVFPEAAWHLDPISPVGDLHPGFIKRAIETNAVIVPVAIEQYRGKFIKRYYVNIGEIIDLTGATLANATTIADYVKDELASLKWEIWEKYGQTSRSNLPKNWEDGYNDFINSIMCDTENGYTIEEIEKTKYHKKDTIPEPTPEEIFSYLKNLPIKKETAFIARDIINEQNNQSLVLKKTI